MTLPDDLNPGIRKLVSVLNGMGFKTTDSGDGETHDHGCDRPYGYVTIVTEPSKLIAETHRLKLLLGAYGFDPIPQAPEGPEALKPEQCHIQASYCPCDGIAIIDVQGVHDREMLDL